MLCVKTVLGENPEVSERAKESEEPIWFSAFSYKRGSFPSLSLHGSAPCVERPSLEKKIVIAASFGEAEKSEGTSKNRTFSPSTRMR